MKQTISFILLCSLMLGSAFAGRIVADFRSLSGRIVPLDGAESIGVYGVTGASEADLPTRTALNRRVDYFITTGRQLEGNAGLQMLQRGNGVDILDASIVPNRAVLMYLRLLDMQRDVRHWLSEACLNLGSDRIVENSLIDWTMYYVRDQLATLGAALEEEYPFQQLMLDGLDARTENFIDADYRFMHAFFRRYVVFVNQVLNPWRDAWEAEDTSNTLLGGLLGQRKLREVISFRICAQALINPNTITEETVAFFDEAYRRIREIDRSPLHTLMALVIMQRQVESMHGVWLEFRDILRDEGDGGMDAYTLEIQEGLLWRLKMLNALLFPKEPLPIEESRSERQAHHARLVELYRRVFEHMLLLYRYANENTRRAGDWVAFLRTGATIDALIVRHYLGIAPLAFGDGEAGEHASEEEEESWSEDTGGDAMELSGENDDDEGAYDALSWSEVDVVAGPIASTVLYTYGSHMNRHGL